MISNILSSPSIGVTGSSLTELSSSQIRIKHLPCIRSIFISPRKGIQNCEECIQNKLENKECFDNINSYILGDKMGKIAFSKSKKKLGLTKTSAVFEKFKNYASEKEEQRTKLASRKV